MHVNSRAERTKLRERLRTECYDAVRHEIHLAMLRLGRPVMIAGISKPVRIEASFRKKVDQRQPVGA